MKTTLNGIHAVQSALESDPGNVVQVWVAESKRNQRVVNLAQQAQKQGLILHKASMNQLDKLAKSRKHQGIVAEYNAPKSWDDNELFNLLSELDRPALLLILDGVTDPHNLGACLRTAEGAGVDAVIAPKDKAAGLTPTARKVASGAAETIPFVQVTNLVRTINLLKDAGVWVTGTSDKATQDLYAGDYKTSTAIVMGAEGKGLRRLTEEHCDHLISIPMAGKVSSLNVSVATGICLYEVVRQRKNELSV
jgi:23S rRNA (guanosine2251-2'-O)-methyltransferase